MARDTTAGAARSNIESARLPDSLWLNGDGAPTEIRLSRATSREVIRILHVKQGTDGGLFATIKENAIEALERLDGGSQNNL